jgi:hypothetical protein
MRTAQSGTVLRGVSFTPGTCQIPGKIFCFPGSIPIEQPLIRALEGALGPFIRALEGALGPFIRALEGALGQNQPGIIQSPGPRQQARDRGSGEVVARVGFSFRLAPRLSGREPVLPGDVEELQDLIRLGVLIPERLQDQRVGDRPVREDQANAPRALKREAARLDQAPKIVERDVKDLPPVDALPQRYGFHDE